MDNILKYKWQLSFVALVLVVVFFVFLKKRKQQSDISKKNVGKPLVVDSLIKSDSLAGKIPNIDEFPNTPAEANAFRYKYQGLLGRYTLDELKKMAIQADIDKGKRNAEGELIDENGYVLV